MTERAVQAILDRVDKSDAALALPDGTDCIVPAALLPPDVMPGDVVEVIMRVHGEAPKTTTGLEADKVELNNLILRHAVP